MRFGLQKLTLLDYPGITACTVFCCGCNFRCPFCHNPRLVSGDRDSLEYSFREILEFLENRQKKLDGICITGGEPLLYGESIQLAECAKAMGYQVKLDTNGSDPEKLQQIIEERYVDFIAMDIKNSLDKYELTSGFSDREKIKQSVQLLLQSGIDYEFRTTVTGNLHTAEDFEKIGLWISGAKNYYLQKFHDSGEILGGDGSRFEISTEKMYEFREIVRKFVPAAQIRGI